MTELLGHDYFTVSQAASYVGISPSQWRQRVQRQFPPGVFFGKQIYRRKDVDTAFWIRSAEQLRFRKPERDREYRLKFPEKFAARAAMRRARKLRATPPWADRKAIAAVYAECRRITLETGIEHHVDHIYPLRGRTGCGLPVHNNLQILTKLENLSKGNRCS